MTKLLISVRNADEARLACQPGVDLIDVKEPHRGSLGAADAGTIEAVADAVAGRVPISVAMGELTEGVALPASLAGRLQYAKFGLAGCATLSSWEQQWRAAIERLPSGVMPVAVAYADWQSAAAPDPSTVVERAVKHGCAAVLLDTFDKSCGSLMRYFEWAQLGEFISAVQTRGIKCVVAGGLGLDEIAHVVSLAPDYVAVRGAVCSGDRNGGLEAARVRRLVDAVRAAHRPSVLAN